LKEINIYSYKLIVFYIHFVTRYELFVPLHELWLQYIEELYGKSNPNIFGQKLLKADYHGAILTGERALSLY
jgi:hypothetical protein